MKERIYASFHKESEGRGGEGRAIIELARQYPPHHAVREFLTNSLDERVSDMLETISIAVDPYQKRIVISDNGRGLPYDELKLLPARLGYSSKKGKIDKRGEKGLGLLAFGSLGDVMHMISRPHNFHQDRYGYVRWWIDEKNGNVPTEPEQLDFRAIQRDFYGEFLHGTMIIIDNVNPHILEKVLTLPYLKTLVQNLYTPALRRGVVNLSVGRIDKRSNRMKSETITAKEYKADTASLLIDDTLRIPIKGDEENEGDLEILLYIDPTASSNKPAIYSKDVLVYESVAELPEFQKSPVFGCGKISGYINDHFNKLILGRAGIDRNRNAFKAWYSALKVLESKFQPFVNEMKKHGRQYKESSVLQEVYAVIRDCVAELPELESTALTRTRRGTETPVTGIRPSSTPHGPIEPPGQIEEEGSTKRPGGGGTFEAAEDGIPTKVRKKKRIDLGIQPQPIEFQAHELYRRSKLEQILGKYTIFINTAHDDYKTRVDLKDTTPFKIYLLGILAKEIASYNARIETEQQPNISASDVVSKVLDLEEKIRMGGLNKLKA